MLKYFNKLKSHHQIMFSVVIGFSIVLFWRGIWGLMDLLTTPMYAGEYYSVYLASFLGSAIIGLLVLAGSGLLMKELA